MDESLLLREQCQECGATYRAPDSCARRFDQLLALDHSRQEPWGSRHGLAFAVFALQHPARYGWQSVEQAFELLTRHLEYGETVDAIVRDFRSRRSPPPGSPAPRSRPTPPFPVTIADLGAFDASTYPDQLLEWCRTTLAYISHMR